MLRSLMSTLTDASRDKNALCVAMADGWRTGVGVGIRVGVGVGTMGTGTGFRVVAKISEPMTRRRRIPAVRP
ncbi:MAG: hypothetical protein A2Y38_05710 [Spirochaetes bacterium GWB1_59_5]|nr:MAG: hypothetical protein A2Y38_05710 [Spirochaetes bacterium GWB1_59_5]